MNKKIPTGITMGIITIFVLLIILYFLPFLFNYILAEKINANKIIKLNTNISPVEAEAIANKLYKLQIKSGKISIYGIDRIDVNQINIYADPCLLYVANQKDGEWQIKFEGPICSE